MNKREKIITFSIIICTYNRCNYLRDTLKSVLELIAGRDNYEIIVVNNNSTDQTSEILLGFANEINVFLELSQGLSHARNRGIKESKNEVLIFLDDDIEMHPKYFMNCEKMFLDPTLMIVGGKVLPHRIKVPDWLDKKYYYLASIFDLGNDFKYVDKLMGANYLMRRSVAIEIGDYDVALGRKGAVLGGGEEVDYLNRAKIAGFKIAYDPELIVFHKINNKLNHDYILNYSYEHGRSEVIVDRNLIKFSLKIIKGILVLINSKFHIKMAETENKKMSLEIQVQYFKGYLNSAFKRQ